MNDSKTVTDFDTILAFQGIRRLQRFYTIFASDMAEGRYNDRSVGDPLDCKLS